ncbi:MAG: hypothetical protein AAGA76_04850 [Pseudomonadota bacterium]
MAQHAKMVAALRRSVAKIDGTQERLVAQSSQACLKFGIDDIDMLLGSGLALGDMHEVRCSLSRDIGCTTGFLMGLLSGLSDDRPIVLLSEPSTALDTGNFFPDGLVHLGLDASRLIRVRPLHLNDCLWAAGETCRTGGLAAIILHVKGNPNLFDLSVSRKLMLRAQTSGTPLFIVRQAGEEEASSAATRWHIKPASSLPDETYPKGVGHMRLTLTLEKNRNGQTGQWLIAWNPKTRSFEHAATYTTASTHTLLPLHPSANRPDSASEMGQVVALERAS